MAHLGGLDFFFKRNLGWLNRRQMQENCSHNNHHCHLITDSLNHILITLLTKSGFVAFGWWNRIVSDLVDITD